MTKDKINIKDLSPHLKELVDRLNCTTSYNEDKPKDSIMHYGQLCNHDDGFLCEHRLEYILNYLNQNNNEKTNK
jgi:hypothetical protein